jgi:hypothetical protein
MAIDQLLILAAGFFVVELLNTSVGHASACVYWASMALPGVAPATMTCRISVEYSCSVFRVYRFGRARLSKDGFSRLNLLRQPPSSVLAVHFLLFR